MQSYMCWLEPHPPHPPIPIFISVLFPAYYPMLTISPRSPNHPHIPNSASACHIDLSGFLDMNPTWQLQCHAVAIAPTETETQALITTLSSGFIASLYVTGLKWHSNLENSITRLWVFPNRLYSWFHWFCLCKVLTLRAHCEKHKVHGYTHAQLSKEPLKSLNHSNDHF